MPRELDPLQRAFNQFILTLPRTSLEQLIQYVHSINDESTDIANECFSQRTDEIVDTINVPSQDESLRANVSQIEPRVAQNQRSREKLRPLNSFIAFRSYYSTAFPDLTQKARSGILRSIWRLDPFKAKWAILAKAYSILRDRHGKEVSLDSFLDLAGRYIGIIEPSKYFQTMGLTLIFGSDQQYTVAKSAESQVDLSHTVTNCSASDIVNYCYDAGYVCRDSQVPSPDSQDNGSVVTFAARPNVPAYGDNLHMPNSIEHQISPHQNRNDLGLKAHYEESPSHSQISDLDDIQEPEQLLLCEIDNTIESLGLKNHQTSQHFPRLGSRIDARTMYAPLSPPAYDIFGSFTGNEIMDI